MPNIPDSQAPRDKKKQEKLEERKPYVRPEILHELKLETRAGSPLSLPDPLDPSGSGP